MAWNNRNNDSFPFGEGHPWRGNPWTTPGVDRAPGAPTPQEILDHWYQRFQNEASFGGPSGGRSAWTPPPVPFMPQRGAFFGYGPRGGRRAQPARDDAGEGSSRDAPQQPTTGVADNDPPTSTPDLLSDDAPSPGTAIPEEPQFPHPPPPPPHHSHQPPPYPGRPHRGGGRGRGGHHPPGGCRGPAHPEPPTNPWSQTFHSLANAIFPNAAANTANQATDEAPFTPPLDLFSTPSAYVLHLALPGAKKDDIGIDWDPDTNTLRVAGVVHRPGDEALLASLLPTTAERRVGYFERLVRLPPREAAEQSRRWRNVRPQGTRVGGDADHMDYEEEGREEIDAAGITARMEDGVLIVTVPKVERGWTEVTKIDID